MNGLFQDFSIADLMKQVLNTPGVLSEGQFTQQQVPMQVPAGAQPTVPQSPQGILNNPQPTMQSPSQPAQDAQQQQGWMDKIGNAFAINKDNFGNRIGNGLIAAGSLDPASAFSKLEAADEAGKIKYNNISGTPYFWYYNPQGGMAVVDENGKAVEGGALKKYLEEKAKREAELAYGKIEHQGQVTRQNQQANTDNKTAAEFRPLLANSQSLLSQYDKALQIVENQGGKAQLQGAFPGIAGAVGGSEVANNKLLQSLAVDETLLNTAKTKGAISDKEMALFKSPIPALTDDRKTVWEPWLKERKAVLEKLSKFYESEAARGDAEGAPASSGGNKPSIQSSSIPGLSSGAAKYFQ